MIRSRTCDCSFGQLPIASVKRRPGTTAACFLAHLQNEREILSSSSMNERCVAILGWRDEPTDAVEEYCQNLSHALPHHGIQLELYRVRWPEVGWTRALGELRRKAQESQAKWFLVQYTALGWSRRGFPSRVIRTIRAIKKGGKSCGVVFHDPSPYPGERLIDGLRRAIQLHTMKKIVDLADLNVLTIPPENISWIPKGRPNVVFIPVGANLPHPETAWDLESQRADRKPTVAVYSISDGALGGIEAKRVAVALRFATEQFGPVRLLVLGRNSEVRGRQLQEELSGSRVEIKIHGLLKADEVVRVLSGCDVLLFVRGPISSRRGSALAGIACGLPVVAWTGWETGPPVTEAGVMLCPENAEDAFGPALVQVLKDDALRATLREHSRRAQAQHFSWDRIAGKLAVVLHSR